MKVTIIPIVIGAIGTVTKGLLKGLEDLQVGGRVETIQTTEESWRLEATCCHSDTSEKPSAKTDVKNPQWLNNKYVNEYFCCSTASDLSLCHYFLFHRMRKPISVVAYMEVLRICNSFKIFIESVSALSKSGNHVFVCAKFSQGTSAGANKFNFN